MQNKKEEHDQLKKLSEKDLWCQDLDAFVAEWELQLKEEADYQKSIRNTNRRASRKIGAGKNGGRGRPKASAADTEYNPKPTKANANKGVEKVVSKQATSFLKMFQAKSKKPGTTGSDGLEDDTEMNEASGLSDNDFATLKASQPAVKEKDSSTSRGNSEQPGPSSARGKRAAAAAPKKWVDDNDEESESDDDKFLGDVGAMVKGIGGGEKIGNATKNGRLSLFAMSRPGSSHGRSTSNDLPKLKGKPSKVSGLDSDEDDQTNYEMLARSSPHKAAPAPRNNLDSFLSDDDDDLMIAKKAPAKVTGSRAIAKRPLLSDDEDDEVPVPKKVLKKAAVPKAVEEVTISSDDDEEEEEEDPRPVIKKAPVKSVAKAVPKAKKAPAPKKPVREAQAKSVALSPAAKAYAAKQSKTLVKKVPTFSDDEDEETMMGKDTSPAPAPAPAAAARGGGRGRPARAAAAKPKKAVYIESDDDDEMDLDDNDESALVEEQSEDDFDDSE